MATTIANSTVGNAVYRGDGVRLYGLDAELELKAQSKRNPQYEIELGKWLEEATGIRLEFPDDLIESLRSGILLCTLINKLLPGTINKINTKPLPLMQIENIGLYLKACWKIGIPSSDLFVTSDLYQRKGIPAVLQNITSVARSSHTCEAYTGPKFGIKPPSQPMAKKWEEIKFMAPVTVADLEKNSGPSPHCDSCGKLKSCMICEKQQQQQPSQPSQQEDKEKDNKITVLSNKVKEQEAKVKEQENKFKEKEEKAKEQDLLIEKLTKSLDTQRQQFEVNENQLKSTILSQQDQIQSKEKQIQNLTNTISVNNRGSTLVNSNVVANVNRPGSAVVSPIPSPTSTPSTSNTNIKENRFSVKLESIKCGKCNFQNSKVSKFCISCGGDIKKDLTNPNQSMITNTSVIAVNNSTSPTSSNFSVNNKIRSQTVVNNNNNNSNEGSAIDKVQLLCNTIKEQEDSISKLNKQIKLESESFEKRLKEQKQTIDNQQILLNQRDTDLKKLEEDNKKFKSSPSAFQNENTVQTTSYITPTGNKHQQNPNEILLNNQSNNQPNRISFSVTGFRSKQVGPGTYQNGFIPTVPKSTSTSDSKELDDLKAMIKLLEGKLNEEITKNRVKDSTIKVLEDKLSTIQSRPTRKQALANSQIVVGRKRFSTLKPDILDSRLVETTLSHINDILFSRPIEFHQVQSLNALFKTEEGRRRFSQILQQNLKHLPTLCLSDSSFEFMLFLLNTILQEMDYSNDHSDFITAKVIFNSSDILYRVNERTNAKDYLKSYITVGFVWKKIQFWEDMFWNMLSKRHRKIQGGTMEKIDKDIVNYLLSYLGVNMIQFNLSYDEIQKFINEMANLNKVSQSDLSTILTSIKTQDDIQQRVNNQKVQNRQQTAPMKPDLSSKSKKDTKKDKKK